MTNDFADWAALAEGEQDRMLVRVAEVAQHLGCTPHDVIRMALDLKRQSDGRHGRPALWLNGIPYFTVADVELMQGKLDLIRANAQSIAEAIADRAARNPNPGDTIQ